MTTGIPSTTAAQPPSANSHAALHRHSLVWLAVFVVIALMFLRLPPMVARQDAVFHTYSALVEVDALARQQYVEAITDDRLVHGAIRGMMFQLDPYSGYIAPEELPAFERRNRGGFTGVGLELGIQHGVVTVIAPIEGSPAARAGIRPGDVITAIDGRAVDGFSVFDVEERLTGAPGTVVSLGVQHSDDRVPRVVEIERGPVTLRTVRGFRRTPTGDWDYLIDPPRRIAYVRISSFLEHTAREFDRAIDELGHAGSRGLILDLRFNPGGVMPQAVGISDHFLEDGVIVATVTRRHAVHEYPATLGGKGTDLHLVVLINEASASAAEIVAGSLQARGRAIIVGERSFGKGSVQNLLPLTEHKAAVKLTTAYYRLPDGRIIHRAAHNAHTDSWGIKPDVEVPLADDEVQAIQNSRQEVDLFLSDDVAPGSLYNDASATDVGGSPTVELIRDRQLIEALTRLARAIDDGT